MTKAQAARASARQKASAARKEAAKLGSQFEALQTQATDQLRALAMRQAPEAGDGKPVTKRAKGKKEE